MKEYVKLQEEERISFIFKTQSPEMVLVSETILFQNLLKK